MAAVSREELIKTAKPILFNAEMVRAILDDRKCTTRRIAKGINPYSEYGDFTTRIKGEWTGPISEENIVKMKCPYKTGDTLYVRQTWGYDVGGQYVYKATYKEDFTGSREIDSIGRKIKWHPSIHMPKEAARIFLKVTDVRVERLQEITIDGIRNEGLSSMAVHAGDMEISIKEWEKLWNSTIKKEDLYLYGWEANPWVWVIEFKRIKL